MVVAGHVGSAWRYRHFILSAIAGELKSRFARSRVGALWHVLNPLAQAAIFAFVLSKVLAAKLGGVENEAAYAIYLMAGMAAWSLFAEITNRSLTIFIEYAGPMKKIAFPRIALPLIVLGGAMLNQALLLAAIAFVFMFFGHFPTAHWAILPLGVGVVAMLGFGIGLFLGVLNIFARDVGLVFGVFFQMWFWLTPIVYTADVLGEGVRSVIERNPVTGVARFYQDVLLYQKWPDLQLLAYPAALGATLCVVAFLLFRRASPEIVDVL